MTTIRKVIELAKKQENGAVLEGVTMHDESWQSVQSELLGYNIRALRTVRIKAPEGVPDHLEWNGLYDVPTKENCAGWESSLGNSCSWSVGSFPDMDRNNGYRYLLNLKKPVVVPYNFETFVLKSSHAIRINDGHLVLIGEVSTEIIIIGAIKFKWSQAARSHTWPDKTPFGVQL